MDKKDVRQLLILLCLSVFIIAILIFLVLINWSSVDKDVWDKICHTIICMANVSLFIITTVDICKKIISSVSKDKEEDEGETNNV